MLSLLGSVLTIGTFDGVHRGHQALIRRAVHRAARAGMPSVAYTFDPPPKAFFQDAPTLTPLPEKVRRLEALGLDHVIVARFDAGYAARDAEDFLDEIADLGPVEVWVGPDFRFGRGGAEDTRTLGARFATRSLEPVRCEGGRTISSTRVRGLLAQGEVGEAERLLGWSA
jgi:riboflavin kinase/FMN adenylyltransferase